MRASSDSLTIIIMTSNTGAREMLEPKNLGFFAKRDTQADYEKMRSRVMEELKNTFKPEFINRIDETIVFRPLDAQALEKIAQIQIDLVKKRCKSQLSVKLVTDKSVAEFITKKGSDVKFGARPIRRAVQVYLEDLLAEEILKGSFGNGDTVTISVTKDGEHLRALKRKKREKL